MRNLLDSTDIAVLFLDEAFNVRRFTSRTTQIIKLIPGDAGRPITDIASNLVYPGLAGDAREVLRTLVSKEKQIATDDGRWFLVRIMPYRTLENRIDGVVITFTDVTVSKMLEAELRKTQDTLEKRFEKQKAELVLSEQRFRAEVKRGQSVKTAGAMPSRRKKGETP
jgi:two-component system CheB/CheR fusion protein